MFNPLISIIIPIYNNEKYMRETLDSIVNQTYKNFEVLCIDDISSDNTINILNEYAKKDSRIRVIERKEKAYLPTPSIILGVEQAKGKYFFYMSHDDIIDNDLLEKSVKRVEETGADIVSNKMVHFYENKNIEECDYTNFPDGDFNVILDTKKAFELALFDKISTFSLINMDLVKELGFDTLYFDSCDYASKIQFMNARKVAFANSCFYYRQDNNAAVSKGFKPYKFEMVLTGCRMLNKLIECKEFSYLKTKYLKQVITTYKSLLKDYHTNKINLKQIDKQKCFDLAKKSYQTLYEITKKISIISLIKLMVINKKYGIKNND